MSKRSLTPLATGLALAGLALPLFSASWSLEQERYLKDSDLKKFGGALEEYLEARLEGKGVTDAESEVKEQIEKLEKKLGKTPAEGDLLASPADLGYGIWLSYDYSGKRVAKAGKVHKDDFWDDYLFTKKEPLEYAVWTPGKYRPKTDKYALIIAIADSGMEPHAHITEEWVDAALREGAIVATPKMSEDTTLWEEMGDGIARVMTVYKELTNNYAVDFDRIYIAGRGRGVKTAVHIASIWPDRFAGVIGRTGEVGSTAPDNFGNLPSYFAGGGAKVQAFAQAAQALGVENVRIQADGKEADIWEWIQANPRNSYPSEITLVATRLTNRMYWLQVPRTDGSTLVSITAKVDKDTNTITVEGVGVNEFTLHFSDAVLDLDKDVTVIANGQEYTDKIARSFRETLNNVYNAAIDPGKVLVASKFYHLPSVDKDD